jgi:hypothetical protein
MQPNLLVTFYFLLLTPLGFACLAADRLGDRDMGYNKISFDFAQLPSVLYKCGDGIYFTTSISPTGSLHRLPSSVFRLPCLPAGRRLP